MGGNFPNVQIWQLNLDPSNRNLVAGTHGRGAWTMNDAAAVPALWVSKADAGLPVGPGSTINYTITVNNIGNADATGVEVTDPIPDNTGFAAAGDGGQLRRGKVRWTDVTVPAGGSVELHYSVVIDPGLRARVKSIVNDGIRVTSAQGVGTTGSAHVTPIAPAFAVTVTPASQTDGAKAGGAVEYHVKVFNAGYTADTYTLAAGSGTFTAAVLDTTCTAPLASLPLTGGSSADVCVRVSVPGGASNGATDTTTFTATSTGSPSVSGSSTFTTIAVTVATLLVDQDGNIPDVQAYYTTALTAAGQAFDVWDLATKPVLPLGYMKAHTNIVWFTGNSYPDPLGVYETSLAAFLDGGGRFFLSGQDVLDQGAGTTAFFSDYMHVAWDGTDTQNDIGTLKVTGELASPVTSGIGKVPLDLSVLGGVQFSDEITPITPAVVAFRDDPGQPDGLSVADGAYKVVFLSFPFEEYGSATQKADLMTRVFTFFGP